MKRFTTFMVMLACFIVGTWAQDVATTATPLESLQSGYYALVMKTADSRTDNTNGNFVYYGSDDLGIHYDEASAATHNLRGKTLNNDDFKYVFYVENNGGKISIKAYGTEYYWPAIPGVSADKVEQRPANQLSFTVNTSAASFSYSVNNGWYYLTTPAQRRQSYWFFGTKWETVDLTALVNINDETHKIGYWESGDKNRCQFQFYAVTMPEPATITYNYIFNGTNRKTQVYTGQIVGKPFPTPTGLPDYAVASKPEGNITGDATIDIEVKENLPFQTSTDDKYIYYYLENVQGIRLYTNGGSLVNRAAEQAENINDVRNDLWYVTGNIFDGFQFHNTSTKKVLRSSAIVSLYNGIFGDYRKTANLAFSGTSNYTDCWDLLELGNNKTGVCPHIGSDYMTVDNFTDFQKVTMDNQSTFSWKFEDSKVIFQPIETNNDAFAFRLVEPTFTIPMYAVGNNTYNSFAAPFDVTLADADSNVKMYKGLVNEEGKELVLTQVDAVPANEGVVLTGESSSEDKVTLKAIAGAQTLENNDLVGTTSDVTELSDKLIFGVSDQTGEVGFFSANSSVASLAANHAYLSKPNTSIFMLSMRIDGQTTAIGSISNDNKTESNAAIYDLAGRKVSKTVKGQFYIQNGRKFIAQ